mgnify:CR=1 FL=1
MKTILQIDKVTGAIISATSCSVDSDIGYVVETTDFDVLEVPNNHPAIHEQKEWTAKKDDVDGKHKLKKK